MKKRKYVKKQPASKNEFEDLTNTVKIIGMLGTTMNVMSGMGEMINAGFKK